MTTLEQADRNARNVLELVQARRQLAAVRALHHRWGEADADDLDPLAMWEALDKALGYHRAPTSNPEEVLA